MSKIRQKKKMRSMYLKLMEKQLIADLTLLKIQGIGKWFRIQVKLLVLKMDVNKTKIKNKYSYIKEHLL